MNLHPCIARARLDSPLGPLTIAATANGLAGLWFDGQAHHPGAIDAPDDPTQRFIAQARDELQAYWQGRHHGPFRVPLDPRGTPFQRRVWDALRTIGFGRTSTYAAVAAAVGSPRAVRAVGAAVGRNPLAIVVPCHRVLGSDGALTGYAGGLPRKQALLELEGAWRRDTPAGPSRRLHDAPRALRVGA
jgi:methylated-DNA-[protein]-cysteine S-methyltransferase